MIHEQHFYVCETCGNIVGMIHDAGVPLVCCGKKMTPMRPAKDASWEKHAPVARREGDFVTVEVGALPHPVEEEHGIRWVYLQTDRGGQRKNLSPGDTPIVRFALCGEIPVRVYACCSQHGLWQAEL